MSFSTPTTPKYTLKKVKSSIRLQNVFRRVSHGPNKGSEPDLALGIGGLSALKSANKKATGKLFGHPLNKICTGDNVPGAMKV